MGEDHFRQRMIIGCFRPMENGSRKTFRTMSITQANLHIPEQVVGEDLCFLCSVRQTGERTITGTNSSKKSRKLQNEK
jgi:hypothetical protein